MESHFRTLVAEPVPENTGEADGFDAADTGRPLVDEANPLFYDLRRTKPPLDRFKQVDVPLLVGARDNDAGFVGLFLFAHRGVDQHGPVEIPDIDAPGVAVLKDVEVVTTPVIELHPFLIELVQAALLGIVRILRGIDHRVLPHAREERLTELFREDR